MKLRFRRTVNFLQVILFSFPRNIEPSCQCSLSLECWNEIREWLNTFLKLAEISFNIPDSVSLDHMKILLLKVKNFFFFINHILLITEFLLILFFNYFLSIAHLLYHHYYCSNFRPLSFLFFFFNFYYFFKNFILFLNFT